MLRAACITLIGCAALSVRAASPSLKIHVASPGVYAVPIAEILEHGLAFSDDTPPQHFRLTYQHRPVPLWVDDGGDGRLGADDRLIFLASHERIWGEHRQTAAPLATLVLAAGAPADESTLATADLVAANLATPPPEATPIPSPTPRVDRLLRFEEDRMRAPLLPISATAPRSMWFWRTISERSSTVHSISLGALHDRATSPMLRLRAHLLGWTHPAVPAPFAQHQVDVRLNDRLVGSSEWNGRRSHTLELDGVPLTALEAVDNHLSLSVPRRVLPGESDPIIDLVYVDTVEARYRVRQAWSHADAPLIAGPTPAASWLPAPKPSDSDQESTFRHQASAPWVFAEAGWSVARHPGGGWILPAMPGETELWVVGTDQLKQPVALATMVDRAPEVPPEVAYLMIAPPAFLTTTQRLAALHRGRGLNVSLVDTHAIYDAYGAGERSASAIRAFLSDVARRSESLRYVLLVGDADWFEADDLVPDGHPEAKRRNRVPTWTHLSDFGPAASDHFFARSDEQEGDEEDESVASPRFAIGRLPVVDIEELEGAIDKIESYLSQPPRSQPHTTLMVSDQTGPSRSRSRRVERALEATGASLASVSERGDGSATDRRLDDQLIEALDSAPTIVHFSGHGSRHTWQLGDSHSLGTETFFDREDVARLAPTKDFPFVVSVSCATAPFDHPTADSLAEVMLLTEDRGAIAFIGASARLYTAPRFGEVIVRALLEGATIGEAMVQAKRTLRSPNVSALYNLLGDPALSLK